MAWCGQVTLKCLRYTGDHPGFAQDVVEYPTPLHAHDLYIELTPRQWAPLYPFVLSVVLRRRGYETEIVIGASREDGFAAHAWLRCGDEVFFEDAARAFTPLHAL